MTHQAPAARVHTQRWLIKRVTVSSGRRRGKTAWGVFRYRTDVHSQSEERIILALLGMHETIPAAMATARLDCALIYDERSRP